MMNITFHVSVDEATVQYAAFACQTAISLAKFPNNITFIAHCMDDASVNAIINHIHGVTCRRVSSGKVGGSNGHATALMDAFSMTNDGNIHVVSDSDAVLLAHGWDAYIVQRIEQGMGFIGTRYEDVGGFSSGSDRIQTYKGVPNFIFAALGPQHDWRGLDITPNKLHRVNITDELLASIYNLPVGFSVFGEAGWQVPQFVHDNGIKYEGWRQLKPTKDAVVLKGLTDYSEEYHAPGGVPFIAHQRGGRQFAYRRADISNNFFAVIDRHLVSETTRPIRW